MVTLAIAVVALVASTLTFFSGFGLGTLLMPAFALFFPVAQAIVLTAIVHFLNGLFKLALVGKHADWGVVLRFGLPALFAAFVGAWLLGMLTGLEPLAEYELFGRTHRITPVKLTVGVLLLIFTLMEALPRFKDMTFEPRYLPLGGILSGLFGGLSGHQGALRAAFLSKAGLSKEAFIGTGVVIACFVDVARLGEYFRQWRQAKHSLDYAIVAVALIGALIGSLIGNFALKKLTMGVIQRIVTVMLVLVSVALLAGLIPPD